MTSKNIFLLFLFSFFSYLSQGKEYNIIDFGAVASKNQLSTGAIQKTIDQCSANGGGKVIIPSGEYTSGSLVLRSNVNIHFEPGAVLYGSPHARDYEEHPPKFHSSTNVYQTCALFFGENISNVAFTGNGTIYFNGGAEDFHMNYDEWRAAENELKRPFGFLFRQCERFLLQDLQLYGSGFWMQQYLNCKHLNFERVKIVNHANWNNDGLDINNCKEVTISGCIIYCSDDAICIKSTSVGLNENIVITNCILRTHYNGFKIGTETMGGGVKNLKMSNCCISAPGYKNLHGGLVNGDNDLGFAGLAIECCDGSVIENISISDIVIDSMRTPLFIRLEKRMRPMYPGDPGRAVGKMRNISISNVLATNASKLSCSITGVPGHDVEGIRLDNIKIIARGGGTKADIDKEVPEKETAYPDVNMFETNLPSYGFFIRHAKNIHLSDITLKTETRDDRYALYLEDVKGGIIDGLHAESQTDANPLIFLEKGKKMVIQNAITFQSLPSLVKIKETPENQIILHGNSAPNITR